MLSQEFYKLLTMIRNGTLSHVNESTDIITQSLVNQLLEDKIISSSEKPIRIKGGRIIANNLKLTEIGNYLADKAEGKK